MKYFKYIQFDFSIINDFVTNHQETKKFLNPTKPFCLQIMPKLYPCLIHCILCQDSTNEQVIKASTNLANLVKNKIKVNKILYLKKETLAKAINDEKKANLILEITLAIKIKKIKLKQCLKMNENAIISLFKEYTFLKRNTIKHFCIFGCFKQNILCDQDPDFISGLKHFYPHKKIDKNLLKQISLTYQPYNTLFTLLMWKINNQYKH